jgi:hypothetical protein
MVVGSMKLIQKLTLTLAALFTIPFVAVGFSQTASAECANVKTSIINCENKKSNDLKDNGVSQILIIVLNIMAGGVAIAAIAGFVYGGILYATAEDKADRVSKAKQTIFNVVLGLILFAFMFSLLQFLIPGGIFT